ncbi:MAG: NUDIX hydrolase [Saprospiraceae bacterium]|nr:NUDIX hydrolase [Bacteroidia bacterium]NNF21995.1 NUDIX hydrolase [Saprospiraceae bacterium]NNK89549.1 NUDIX hydrolase [Saprospiraceae bacterium]
MPFQNDFFKSAFSVDNVIFGFDNDVLKVLLIKRRSDPYGGQWALPGDRGHPDEDLDDAALRVLEQLTGVKDVYLEQVHTFGKVNRHPKGRVITIAYYSLVNITNVSIRAASFADKVEWKEIRAITSLAYDHYEIMQTCLERLRQNVKLRPIGFELLPTKFTLTEMQRLYESILEKDLDKRNFRKKILSMHILKALKEQQQNVAHRPAMLYSFDAEKYELAKKSGFIFEL